MKGQLTKITIKKNVFLATVLLFFAKRIMRLSVIEYLTPEPLVAGPSQHARVCVELLSLCILLAAFRLLYVAELSSFELLVMYIAIGYWYYWINCCIFYVR